MEVLRRSRVSQASALHSGQYRCCSASKRRDVFGRNGQPPVVTKRRPPKFSLKGIGVPGFRAVSGNGIYFAAAFGIALSGKAFGSASLVMAENADGLAVLNIHKAP